MKLVLVRPPDPMMRHDSYTLGFLYIDGAPFCFTLEDTVRTPFVKIREKTAIPDGSYHIVMTFSPHFNRIMPELVDVPFFSNIRIHAGNSDLDTAGCILVGDMIAISETKPLRNSLDAFNRLMEKLTHAFERTESVSIDIKGTFQP